MADPNTPTGGANPNDGDPADADAKLANLVNSAVSAHLKRELPKLGKGLSDQLGASLAEQLAKLAPKGADPAGGDPSGAGGKEPAKDPAYQALRLEMDGLKKANAEERAKREASEVRERNGAARTRLTNELGKHIRPELLEDAVDLAFARGRIAFDEDGTPLYRTKRDGEEVLVPIEDGVAQFVKSPQAAAYLPAPGAPAARRVGGARMQNGARVYETPATTDEEKVRRAMERAADLQAQHPHIE